MNNDIEDYLWSGACSDKRRMQYTSEGIIRFIS